MATQTLVEAKKLINNQIVAGVAEDIITTNPIFLSMPYTGYDGQAMLINRENALGNAQHLAIGAAITAKAAATYTQIAYTAVTTIGDAEMNGLVGAQSSSAGVDQLAIEIMAVGKIIICLFQNPIM